LKLCISIIICTLNHANTLDRTIASICESKLPSGIDAELLIVDNGSDDRTAEISIQSRNTPMAIRWILEPTRGQCFARNRGLAESVGEILIFTDDDIKVPTNWIEGMCRPIMEDRLDAVAGGVEFPSDYTPLLSQEPYNSRRTWFASTQTLDRVHPDRMVGANMAFHRRVLRDVPSFDTELGPGALGFGDETLFSLQLCKAGYRLGAALDVAVEHHFDLNRLKRYSMIEIAQKMGRSEGFLAWHWRHEQWPSAYPAFLKKSLRYATTRFLSPAASHSAELVSGDELDREYDIASHRQYLIERRRPQKYARQSAAELSNTR